MYMYDELVNNVMEHPHLHLFLGCAGPSFHFVSQNIIAASALAITLVSKLMVGMTA